MNNPMFSINGKDFAKGLLIAVLSGVLLPVSAMIQTPGFDLATVNWSAVLSLAMNGAVVGFISYMMKNFLSTEDGKFLGTIG